MKSSEVEPECAPLVPVVFPPISWWRCYLCNENRISTACRYQKSQHPNRYAIANANGIHLLTIPIQGGRDQQNALGQVRIAEQEGWRTQHYRALQAAYGRTPFWEHYAPEMEHLLQKPEHLLQTFAIESIRWMSAALRISLPQEVDFPACALPIVAGELQYRQIFEERRGFVPALSALDALLNIGPSALRTLLLSKEH